MTYAVVIHSFVRDMREARRGFPAERIALLLSRRPGVASTQIGDHANSRHSTLIREIRPANALSLIRNDG
jgi:hypothetical protein